MVCKLQLQRAHFFLITKKMLSHSTFLRKKQLLSHSLLKQYLHLKRQIKDINFSKNICQVATYQENSDFFF